MSTTTTNQKSQTAHGYSPMSWTWVELSHVTSVVGYFVHIFTTLWLAFQCLVAGVAGFTHAFFPSFFPFVAEEIGTETSVVVQHNRGIQTEIDATLINWPYAFSPHRWVYMLDGAEHVKFSGGSYINHMRFANWASGQFIIGFVLGVVHAFIPFLFPYVTEEVCIQLGLLIRNRRKLRNEGGIVNPDNLNEYFGEKYKARFERASKSPINKADYENLSDAEIAMMSNSPKIAVRTSKGGKLTFL